MYRFRRQAEKRRTVESAAITQAQIQALEYAQRIAAGWSTGNIVTARFDEGEARMSVKSFIWTLDEAIRNIHKSGNVL